MRRWPLELARRAIGIFVALGGSSCSEPVFHCSDDAACVDARGAGVCVPPGYCAFQSEDCSTGLAYGSLAPSELSGECVPVSNDDGAAATGSSTGSDPVAEGSGDGSSSGSTIASESGLDGAPCAAGTPCDPDDPCVLEATCDLAGACVPVTMVACDDPPGGCHEATGTCDSTGECVYAPRAAGDACDDGDDCTEGDACDGAGACVAGELCPNDDPCSTRSCTADGCVAAPVEDGTSCGAEAAARCCGGACVDISSDTAHCGGCNTACAPGLDCESISETGTCDIAPEATSGRCRCEYSNAQCPNGQICRTYTPYTDRCVPPSEANCDGSAFYQNSCPSFCGY